VGAILIMVMPVIFLLILTWGGARFAWTSPLREKPWRSAEEFSPHQGEKVMSAEP
jgi:hypothetical protein